MYKIGVIGISGGWSSEAVANALEARTGFRLMVKMDRIRYDSEQNTCFYEDTDLLDLDGLIIKKIGARYSPDHLQRLDLLRFLAGRGLRIFSDPVAVSRCLDRLSCTLTLRLGGIPMPPTDHDGGYEHGRSRRPRVSARPSSSPSSRPRPGA